MDPRGSFHTYPRVDKLYKQRGSLNFDIVRTRIFKDWSEPMNHDLMIYFIYALIGISTGLIAVFITGAEDEFAKLKARITSDIIDGQSDRMVLGWLFFTLFSTGMGLLSSVLVAYKAPQAAGSGTPELIGYLNGINFSDFFGTTCLIVKIITLITAGVAGLCVGKAGTYPYLGAMIGMGVLYLPIRGFEYFHNDAHKREFISCGMSCGIAAAFGAPIGGTLFGFEISRPNSFWEVSTTWRTMLACCLAVISYSLMKDCFHPLKIENWVLNSATLQFSDVTYPNPTVLTLPTALIVGSICGLLGAAFVYLNTLVQMFRR
jgi:chloride channel 7